MKYLKWLREFACCKPASEGGVHPDARGKGIKPWALADMSLIAFYRSLYHKDITLFPVLPSALSSVEPHGNEFARQKDQHLHVNISYYAPGGHDSGMYCCP
jgi:hypothetical protein